MIKSSKALVAYLEAQQSKKKFMRNVGISTTTWYRLINGDDISSEVVAKILKATGMDFEKAFDVRDEKNNNK